MLAGIAALIAARRRKTTKFEDSIISGTDIKTNTVFGSTGGGVVNTGDNSLASDFSREGLGNIDTDEVDPIAEAEVYLAYGRDAQAEEILKGDDRRSQSGIRAFGTRTGNVALPDWERQHCWSSAWREASPCDWTTAPGDLRRTGRTTIPGPEPRTDDLVRPREPRTTSTRIARTDPPTLPLRPSCCRILTPSPYPPWFAFAPETGRFVWTELPVKPDVSSVSTARTLLVRSPMDPELAQISCTGMCTDLLAFGPAPDEVTVLVSDLSRAPVNPGPSSLALVYGIMVRCATRSTWRRSWVRAARGGGTRDWAPPDGSEALIADIEWPPDGSRLAVSTYPGFFEPDCLPAAEPCEARSGPSIVTAATRTWSIGAVLRPGRRRRVGPDPDESGLDDRQLRLGMVLDIDNQDQAKPPPSLVGSTSSRAVRRRCTSSASAGPAGRPDTGSPGHRTAPASRSPVVKASASRLRRNRPLGVDRGGPGPSPGSRRCAETLLVGFAIVPVPP